MGTAGKIIENPAPRYVDLMTDSGFKAVFGEPRNKRVLIDLLNIVLPPERTVSDIEYSTTELPGLTFTNKNVRLDLRCTDKGGRQFVVEMQSYRQEYFFRRCVEYAAKVYDSGSAGGRRSAVRDPAGVFHRYPWHKRERIRPQRSGMDRKVYLRIHIPRKDYGRST